MRPLIVFSALFLSGCGITGNLGRNYGDIRDVGYEMECGIFTVTSFSNFLRSSPKIYGDNTFVGYEDFGPGMSRGTVFVALLGEIYFSDSDLVTLLTSSDPRKRSFWQDAELIKGSIQSGEFLALVPEDATAYGANKIIRREQLMISAKITSNGKDRLLVMAQSTEAENNPKGISYLDSKLKTFLENIKWREEANQTVEATPFGRASL